MEMLLQLINGWQRRRQARHLRRELEALGYTPEVLKRMARLRASVDHALTEPTTKSSTEHTVRPTLGDVLLAWQ